MISYLSNCFHLDALATTMTVLVVFIGLMVILFAKRYLHGDSRYVKSLSHLTLLVLCIICMVASDQLAVMLLFWGVSNALLVSLMIHNPKWQAAKNSGWLAAKSLGLGFVCIAIAFILFFYATHETSIQLILKTNHPNNLMMTTALLFLLVGAMSQSAIWPFHRWLLSSLNSPTPVSAIMHAGLVNGGGFLLVRFAPLYSLHPKILATLFILGIGTALVGTLWKLMQNDVKRMLACSTLGQMGFMFAQCGLGLFPAAIAHLCWHSLFKANLFLSSSSAATENRLPPAPSPTLTSFSLALLCGTLGGYLFTLSSHKVWQAHDTTFVLISLSFIAATQFALPILKDSPWKHLPICLVFTALMSSFYGLSVWTIERIVSPLHIQHPQQLNALHFIGLFLLSITWIMFVFRTQYMHKMSSRRFALMMYVKNLNASQPHASTITAHRNQYSYL
jgi:NAD(P)H-quinone oxidoreductase subunit 5